MHYKISYKKPHQHLIDIEFTIDNISSDELLVQLPAWRPGRYELGNFAQNVKTFQPKNNSGKKLEFKKITKDLWKIFTDGANSVSIFYSYYANELNAGSTFLDENQLYVNGVNCLLYVPERINEKCTLELQLPKNFEVATGLKKLSAHKFSAHDFHDLVDCPFIAGDSLQKKTYTAGGTKFYIWFQGIVKPEWQKIISDFEKFTQAQLQLFGAFPFSEYHFLFQILPAQFYHGVEHTNSTVIALGPSYAVMKKGYEDFVGVSSHELFHAWNVKTIRPAEMMPYDYAKENYTRLGYVTEGVTTYYGDLMLLRSQVFSEEQYRKEFNKLLERHFSNAGRLNLPVSDSSFDTWLDGYKAGVPGRKSSIYVEGALCAFILDINIRRQTKNKRSLDDVMRFLFNEFGKKQKGFSEKDYQKAAEKIAGADLSFIFINYINGTKPLNDELENCLEYIGYVFTEKKANSASEEFYGFRIQASGEKTIVTSVLENSPADKSGLAIQDEIIAVNNLRIENNLNDWLQYFSAENKLALTVATNKIMKEINLTRDKKYDLPVLIIQKSPSPTAFQEKNFELWSSI